MKQVFVVIGATGEYSDHSEWPVRAFLDENAAKNWVEKCSAYCRENHCAEGEDLNWSDAQKVEKENPYDKSMQIDYTGTNYFYWALELEE